jgi:hypothetical protein
MSDDEKIQTRRVRRERWTRGAILGAIGVAAAVVVALPTIGAYTAHVAAIWRCPEQQIIVQNVVSNEFLMQQKDVRDIKHILYHPSFTPPMASTRTNSIYE